MSRWYYRSSGPKAVKGGIKAQSKRGAFAANWWAQRWIAVLESFHIGARLGRGKTYARQGQVLSIDIDKGIVTAQVQGSRRRPYDVKLAIKTLTKTDWRRVGKTLVGQIYFLAKLLSGEMPREIENVFTELGLSLFPAQLQDLKTNCSCPDWSNPCKHIAAVFYLLGEEFDRDPFLIIKLRGMDQEELLGLLGGDKIKGQQPAAANKVAAPTPPAEPLTADLSRFWQGEEVPDNLFGEVGLPAVNAALPKRLGNFPFWRGAAPLLESLQAIYARASQSGLEVYLGERRSASVIDR
jgi:uncharacterized Zn finger protein